MKQTKTLVHKIKNHSRIFDDTIKIYNEALSFIIEVIDLEFSDLSLYSTKDMTNEVERLIHATKKNPIVKYVEFDRKFYKFPSYLRRSAISAAFGKMQSYRSLYQNWCDEKEKAQEEKRVFKHRPPTKQFVHKEFPVLYKGNMFLKNSPTEASIKAFVKNDWVWVDIVMKSQDLTKRGVSDWKEQSPKLVRKGKKYFLTISYEKEIKLNKTKLKNQKVCAVDLGLTNSAVCSIVSCDGTVLARKFIKQKREKDLYKKTVNKLKKVQSLSKRPIKAPRYWNRINGLRLFILRNTSTEIVRFAKEHDADVIVFEYLGKLKATGFGAKKLREKLHHWDCVGIQNKVTEMAHYLGIRISRINPRNTSKFAFDGSGEVKRNGRKDLATFKTGKIYHADLSASYNIAARYFIREAKKAISEKKWSSLVTKVSPDLERITSCTLSSLIALRKADTKW